MNIFKKEYFVSIRYYGEGEDGVYSTANMTCNCWVWLDPMEALEEAKAILRKHCILNYGRSEKGHTEVICFSRV